MWVRARAKGTGDRAKPFCVRNTHQRHLCPSEKEEGRRDRKERQREEPGEGRRQRPALGDLQRGRRALGTAVHNAHPYWAE